MIPTILDVAFVIPSRNTPSYLKLAYSSVREHYPLNEIVILDESDEVDSWNWMKEVQSVDPNLIIWRNNTGTLMGHTITYDLGVSMTNKPLFSIFHSDMVCSKGYVENLIKHWKPKHVIAATRVEPVGIYGEGKEKILKPFGATDDTFLKSEFDSFVTTESDARKDEVTYGIFAPWLMSRDDFFAIGGHDHVSFAPYPIEDSDIFLRFALAGYRLIQSRDSLCYHFISKGHRNWAKNGIGKDDDMFKFYQTRAVKNYVRKWNRMFSYDEFHHPIVHPVYDIGFVLTGVKTPTFLSIVEPYATRVYVDNKEVLQTYIQLEQPTTNVDLANRVYLSPSEAESYHDILLYIDEGWFMENLSHCRYFLTVLGSLIDQLKPVPGGEYQCDKFKLRAINSVKDIAPTLIKVTNPTL